MNRKAVSRIMLTLLFAALLAVVSLTNSVEAAGYTDITVTEAKAMIDSTPLLVVLDVRTPSEYDSGHLRNAKLIPVTELPGRLDELNKTDEILVYCKFGGRSSTASQILADNGFLHVYNMLGGTTAWISQGYPVYIKYASIQEAINNAKAGDVIHVSTGTYFENVLANKSVSLVGENPTNTVIDGNRTGKVIKVMANNVVIEDFTIQKSADSEDGIHVEGFNHTIIRNNNITDNRRFGIGLINSSVNIILENEFTDDWIGIYIRDLSNNNTITGNSIRNNGEAIGFWDSHNNTISGNSVENNVDGVELGRSQDNLFVGNKITSSSGIGIQFGFSANNKIYHNNLINNKQQVYSFESENIWDHGYPSGGNYWSDYSDVDLYCGPNQDFPTSDGIWDHPYVIDENNKDNYPLKKPFSLGTLSVTVSTDKGTYHAGNKMYVGLNVENPDSVKYLCFAIWVTLPDSSIYLYMHEHSVVLPIGLKYTNPTFQSITLPSLPSGKYTWHAALLERTTHKIIVEDTAEWEFV